LLLAFKLPLCNVALYAGTNETASAADAIHTVALSAKEINCWAAYRETHFSGCRTDDLERRNDG
jgi:hypothetical protein